jgi:general secretion pathway protein K
MPAPRARERGVALLLVLWIFTILGVLALDFARYMRDDAMATVNLADETRGYYLALAGINRAIFDAERLREREGTGTGTAAGRGPDVGLDDDDEDEPLVPPDGEWHEGDFAGGRWKVRMIDEAGRIALNKVEEPLLTRIVSNLMQGGNSVAGMDRRAMNQVATVVDSILDWRDHDNLARLHGAESDFYSKRRVPYRAKNANFDSPEELMLVRGVTPALFYGSDGIPGLKDVVSVYGRSGKLNPNTAPAPVLQALLGTDAAADLLEQRTAGTPIADLVKAQLLAIDPGLEGLIEPELKPRIVRIEAYADVVQERNQSHVALVADLQDSTSEGTRILRWLDRAPWDGPSLTPEGGEAEDYE